MISGRTTPLEQAISEGSVSVDADFLSNAQAEAIAGLCSEHAALWRRCPADWELVLRDCDLDLKSLYPYWNSSPGDAEMLLLGCGWFERPDNRRHLEQITEPLGNGAGPWRRVRGSFAHAFRKTVLRGQLSARRAIGCFDHEQLKIYLLVPQIKFGNSSAIGLVWISYTRKLNTMSVPNHAKKINESDLF